MTDRQLKLLADIDRAIELIGLFQIGISTFEQYQLDLKSKSAIERQIAIIGEALVKLSKEEPGLIISNGRQIISLRNRLVHAYDSIDDSIMWAIIKSYMIPLKEELSKLRA
jgi:uncharacterized protein with HEPN domain